jgi:hypothetical protein
VEGISLPDPHPPATISKQKTAADTIRLRRKTISPKGANNVAHSTRSCRGIVAEPATPVATVTETVVEFPSTGTLDGATLHVELAGAPAQVRFTFISVTAGPERRSKGKTALWPLVTVTDDGPLLANE